MQLEKPQQPQNHQDKRNTRPHRATLCVCNTNPEVIQKKLERQAKAGHMRQREAAVEISVATVGAANKQRAM